MASATPMIHSRLMPMTRSPMATLPGKISIGRRRLVELHTSATTPLMAISSPMVDTIWTCVSASRSLRNNTRSSAQPNSGASTSTMSGTAIHGGTVHVWL